MKRADLAWTALLPPLDALTLLAAASAAYALRFTDFFTQWRPVTFTLPFADYIALTLQALPIFLAVFAVLGLYSTRPPRLATEAARIIMGVCAGMAALLAIAFFSRELFDSRFIVLAAWGCAVVFLALERLIVRLSQRWLRRFGVGVSRCAVIGKTRAGNALFAWLSTHPGTGMLPTLHEAHATPELLERLRALARNDALDAIILANPEAHRDEISALKHLADTEHLSFFYAADLFPGAALRPIVHSWGQQPVIEVPKTPLDGWGAIYKRSFDIVASSVCIVLTSPLQLLVVLALLSERSGGVLFRKLPNGSPVIRVGQRGKPFRYFKFRSMIPDAHQLLSDPAFLAQHENLRKGTPLFKLKDDPRVTRVGKILRSLSLDELPELYLVLMGRMSLVGPRPHLPEEVARYTPEQRRVMTVKPGMTGMAQISGRADLDFQDEVALDMHYIENWSPWLDLIILLKTPLVVALARRKGAY